MTVPAYNRTKFKQLVLLLSERSSDDPKFGSTKLNKLLHFCDFDSYRLLGHAITGARYQKEEHGPVAAALIPIQDEMVASQQLRIETRERGGHPQAVTVALESPGPHTFSADELEIIDEVLERLRSLGAVDVSEYAHEQSAGWLLVDMGDPIPYSLALVSTERPPDAAFAFFRELHGLAA
jgi:Protein of unknown function (DUF4065)